jgi:hypothetical protein
MGTNAAQTPWIRGDGQPGGAHLQELCLERALLAVERSERVIGAFLWKWFPSEPRREDFQIQQSSMRETVRRRWIEDRAGAD